MKTWRYHVRDESNNKTLKSEGGFATEEEAQAVGGEYAKRLAATSGSQLGPPTYSVTASWEESSSQ